MNKKIKRIWPALWGKIDPIRTVKQAIVKQIEDEGTDALVEVAQCDACAEALDDLPIVLVLCQTCGDRITAGTLELQRRGGTN